MKNFKIAVVNSDSFGKYFPRHISQLEEIGPVDFFHVAAQISGKELAAVLQGYNLIIASVTPNFSSEFFEEMDELLLIARHGIGFNNIDVAAARKKGTAITIVSPAIERDAVAENAVANLMTIVRQTSRSMCAAQTGDWGKRAEFIGHNFSRKTFGVIGAGNIGTRVAEIFKYGFNGHVLVSDPAPRVSWAQQHGIDYVPLEELLAKADYISLNASLTATSRKILNEKTLAKIKKGVYITNAARGALMDEKAVLAAVESGQIKGMAVDVLTEEPANENHPFLHNPQILVTPHTSAYTYECLEQMGDKCIADVKCVISGQVPVCLKN